MGKLIGMSKIMKLTGLSYKAAVWISLQPTFPRKVINSERDQGWDEDELQDWLEHQVKRRNRLPKR